MHDVVVEVVVGDLGQVVRRVGLELLEEHALGGDLRERLTVGRARHRDRDGARRTVAREPDHADVVAEVLAAELRADAEAARHLEHLGLHVEVAEGMSPSGSRGRQPVEVARARVLRGLERVLRRRAADDDGEVVRRARGRAERAQLLVEELAHRRRVEHGLGLLEQQRLVRRAAALGHEEELVRRLVPGRGVGVELDLRRQVGAGVLLVPHGQRRHLRVAQVERRVGVVDALADRALVVARGEHLLAALAHDDRRAGVLAHRQDAARGDVHVLEQVERDEAVVGARLGVVEDVRAAAAGDRGAAGAGCRGSRWPSAAAAPRARPAGRCVRPPRPSTPPRW